MSAFFRFASKRLVAALTTLIIVSFVVFTLMEFVPGNCAERYLAYKDVQGIVIDAKTIAAEVTRMGLDEPYVIRWYNWITGITFRGDFGISCLLRVDVRDLIGDKLFISLGLSGAALVVTYLMAVPIGIASATARGGLLDSILRVVSYLGLALPNFLLALCVMLFSTVVFGETLTGLFSDEFRNAPWSPEKVLDMLSRAWLPILILAWSATAFQLQTVRALMSDEIGKLYVTAARSRGMSGRALMWRYPARHALGPVINSVGYDLSRIFADLPIVATVLILTDAGALLLNALVTSNDQQLAGAIIFIMTATIVFFNFVTDLILAAIDPRVRRGLF